MLGKLPSRPVGSDSKSVFMQWVYDTLRSQTQVSGGPGCLVRQTTRGTSVVVDESIAQSGGSKVTQYVVTDFTEPDYFICRTLARDGTCGTTDVFVAKPYNLRQGEFDGREVTEPVEIWDDPDVDTEDRTYEYDYQTATLRIKTWTKTNGAAESSPIEEAQVITPRLVAGIIGIDEEVPEELNKVINEGATVIYAVTCSQVDVVDGDDNPITKLALNDGWAWARART